MVPMFNTQNDQGQPYPMGPSPLEVSSPSLPDPYGEDQGVFLQDGGPHLYMGDQPPVLEYPEEEGLFGDAPGTESPVEEESAAPNLGVVLEAEFVENQHLRRTHEERWLKDIRQFKGVYEPDVESLLSSDPNRARTFIRLTKTKVRTVLSRMMDLLFPMSGQLNWDLQPTPNAELPPHVLQQVLMEKLEASGGVPPEPADLQHAVQAEAAKRAESMKMEIYDQLKEKPGRAGYQATIREVLRSALIYGTGVLKGPLVQRKDRKRWVMSFKLDRETGQQVQEWDMIMDQEDYLPYYESVPLWDFYPDATATDISQCRFVWQTHLMQRTELLELAKKDFFDFEVVRKYITDNPKGDAVIESHEADVRRVSDENLPSDFRDRYRLKERWGLLTGDQLADAGLELDESELHNEYYSNVWLLGDKVIKAAIEPVRGVELPYYVYLYDHDESSFWGEGICADMRDPQAAFNAVIRKILDQYGKSGSAWGVNLAAMAPGEDPREIHSDKVFLFEGSEDMNKAMQMYVVPAFTQEGMNMAQFLQNYIDETTAPRFMQGDSRVGGAGDTASGLSMLMGAVNVNITGLVKNFDDQITTPFITAMFHWNMAFNEKEHIKGDFCGVAKGSTALMAKEVRAEKLVHASQLLANPNFAPWVREDEMLLELFQAMDVRPDLVRTQEEFEARMKMESEMQAEAQAKAMLKTAMNEARSRGLMPEQALMQILQESAPQAMQGEARVPQDASQRQMHVQPPQGM